jgi:hypothetical protein
MPKQQRWGVPQNVGQNATRILMRQILTNITQSIFVEISIMTTIELETGSREKEVDLLFCGFLEETTTRDRFCC